MDAQLDITGRDVHKHFGPPQETALHIAARKNLLEAAKWLINEGADLEAKNEWGWTPLHRAAKEDSIDVAQLLIDRGADKKAKDNDGDKPIDLRHDSFQMFQLLGGQDRSGKHPWVIIVLKAKSGH